MATTMLDAAQTVGEVLERAAAEYGNCVAVEDSTGTLTFVELHHRARRLAAALLERGLLPGDRVLEALPNSCELLVSEMALALAGLVRVPLNPRLGPREWRGIHADSGARGLLVDGRLEGADGARIAEHIHCEVVVRADDGGLAAPIADRVTAALPAQTTDDLVGLAYSSGTTGAPKGARRTHRMRMTSARAMLRDVIAPTGEASGYLHAGPAIHTSGLFILPMLALGVRQVMGHHLSAVAIAETISSKRITHLALVPSVIDALTRLPDTARQAFAGVRMLAYAGAPMPPAHIHRAAELLTDRLVQYYGLVEAMPPLTVLGIDDHARGLGDDPQLLKSAGRIVREADLTISADGEVVISGPMVTPGYWNAKNRADLGKSFDGAALRTGDVGSIHGNRLFLTDRRNNMLISGGYNVYPGEIERALASVPGLRDAVVVGLPDQRWGQRIVLAYSTASGRDLDAAAQTVLRQQLDTLAAHKRPKEWYFRSEFPLGATGKIDRRALVAQLTDDQCRPMCPSADARDERNSPT